MRHNLGEYCHWDGEYVSALTSPRTGKHIFCCKACKQAHWRAFKKATKRPVILAAPRGRRAGKDLQRKSNKPTSGHESSRLQKIVRSRKGKSNAGRGKK